MKTYSLFLLTIMMVTAAPAAALTTDQNILREIIDNVQHLDHTLNDGVKKMFVQEVISAKHCTPQNICKAGEVLKAFKAEDLGLQEKDWLLPRRLVAYTRNIQCKNSASDHNVQLHNLLRNIQRCAQMFYRKPPFKP